MKRSILRTAFLLLKQQSATPACAAFLVLNLSAALPSAAAAAEPSHRMIEVAPDVSLRVLDRGPKNSLSPVVLIPGWGMSADVWSDQADILSRTRRVIAFDPRSQGQSTVVAHGVTPERRAEDLQALFKALGLRNVTLVGWSQGVQDIAAYVQKFGTSEISGAVLVDAPISVGSRSVAKEPGKAAQMLSLLSLYAASPKDFAEGTLRHSFRKPLEPARRARILNDILATPTAIGTAMIISSRYGPDRTAAIPGFDRPVLVVASSQSADLETLKAQAEALPCGSFEAIDDAGHAVFVDQPTLFSDLLAGFLSDRTVTRCPQPTTGLTPPQDQ